jgi:transposase InsO family protein
LAHHREVIVAFDSFTVPTATFQLLYCFFVLEHGRRRILHFNVTEHPTAERVVQQLREAFPEAGPYRYAIFMPSSIQSFGEPQPGPTVFSANLKTSGQFFTERVRSGPGSTQVIEKTTSGKGGHAPSLPDGYTYSL